VRSRLSRPLVVAFYSPKAGSGMRDTTPDKFARQFRRFPLPASRFPLSPRPAMDVEDRAATTLAADQPVPLASISQPEGATTDLAPRHCHHASRTHRRFPRCELLANLLELSRAVLRRPRPRPRPTVTHSGIRTTILPNCCPLWSLSKACRPCEMSNTESTSGVSRPARNSLVTASNSDSFPIVEPMMSH